MLMLKTCCLFTLLAYYLQNKTALTLAKNIGLKIFLFLNNKKPSITFLLWKSYARFFSIIFDLVDDFAR